MASVTVFGAHSIYRRGIEGALQAAGHALLPSARDDNTVIVLVEGTGFTFTALEAVGPITVVVVDRGPEAGDALIRGAAAVVSRAASLEAIGIAIDAAASRCEPAVHITTDTPRGPVALTLAQLQLLTAIAGPSTIGRLAHEQEISTRVLEARLTLLYRHLGVHGRTQAVAWLLQRQAEGTL